MGVSRVAGGGGDRGEGRILFTQIWFAELRKKMCRMKDKSNKGKCA